MQFLIGYIIGMVTMCIIVKYYIEKKNREN